MQITQRTVYPAIVAGLALSLLAAPSYGGWKDWLNSTLENVTSSKSGGTGGLSSLSEGDVVSGLKAALDKGIGHAVELLGQKDGFLGNPKVSIPIPELVQPLAKTLRTFGQGKLVDDFQTTLNRAAEAAVPEGKEILVDAVKGMSVEDAWSVLKGGDDAATRYFEKSSRDRLREKIMPIVNRATEATGVTSSYKGLARQAGPVAGMLGMEVPDLDDYVAGKALDGLFVMIAEEEKAIRANPAARTTELLQRVFSQQ